MEELTLKIIVGVIIAVVSSVLSSFITFHLAIARYRNEKWWELKAVTYQDIIRNLSDSVRSLNAVVNTERNTTNPDKSFMDAQTAMHDESSKNIRRIIDVGSFIMSNSAEKRLVEYETRCALLSKNPVSNVDFLDDVRKETKRCLDDIKTFASEDLRR